MEETAFGWSYRGYKVYRVDKKTRKILPKKEEDGFFRVFDPDDHLISEESSLEEARKTIHELLFSND